MLDSLILLVVLLICVVTDLRKHKIYNSVCLAALLAGLALHWGKGEYWQPVAAILAAFVIFLPFYLLKGMAAGDVKLMASSAAIIGWPFALIAVALTLISGTIAGLLVYCVRGGIKEALQRYGFAIKCFFKTGKFFIPSAADNSIAKSRFPYAIAIALGCGITQLMETA